MYYLHAQCAVRLSVQDTFCLCCVCVLPVLRLLLSNGVNLVMYHPGSERSSCCLYIMGLKDLHAVYKAKFDEAFKGESPLARGMKEIEEALEKQSKIHKVVALVELIRW